MLYEAIPPSLATLLRDIRNWQLPSNTYMAGGTALAVYLNHRVSVDIDLFTDKEFYCGPIISTIRQKHTITVINPAEKDTFIANVDNIKFSLFNYPYPLLKPLVDNPDFGIKLASPEDISAMKVVAITQRGTAKDFVDLRALMAAYGLSLNYLIEMVQKKYGVSKDYEYQVKKSLIYFDDAIRSLDAVTLIKSGKGMRMEKSEWNEVEGFFKRLIFL